MKVLLDENLPKRLKTVLKPHDVYTVREMGWNSKKNGELMILMSDNNFDLIITFDKNIEYQQNFKKFTIPVLILNAPDNTFATLKDYKEKILTLLETSLPAGITKVD